MDLRDEDTRKTVKWMYWDQGITQTAISAETDIPQNTLSDFLCKKTWQWWWDMQRSKVVEKTYQEEDGYFIFNDLDRTPPVSNTPDVISIHTSLTSEEGCTHLTIADTQCREGIDLSYLRFIGQYIVDRRPEVIIHIGDHADMLSLSSYDKGRKAAEGKRVYKDIQASIEGMNELLGPIARLQTQEMALHGEIRYKPRMVLTLGNHENRIDRHVEAHPELDGFLSIDSLRYAEMGWEVQPYLQPIIINGVTYVHFLANPLTGRPYGGTAMNILKNVGESYVQGHRQLLDVATRFLPASGRQQWGIIAGACYEHDEPYKGPQGNHHWRGVIVQHEVRDGSFQPMFVDVGYLRRRYAAGEGT